MAIPSLITRLFGQNGEVGKLPLLPSLPKIPELVTLKPKTTPTPTTIQTAIAQMTPEQKWQATGQFSKEVVQMMPRVFAKVIHSGVTTVVAGLTGKQDILTLPMELPKYAQPLFGKKPISTYAGDTMDAIASGVSPIKAVLLNGLFATWDATMVGALVSSGARSILKNVAVPEISHVAAWEAMGRPVTMAEEKATYRQLAHKLHPDKPTGDAQAMSAVNNAHAILEKEGIPTKLPQPLSFLRDIAQILETPISQLSNMKSAEPFFSIAGELPGLRERPGQAPAMGLSMREMEPVGGAPKPLPSIKIESAATEGGEIGHRILVEGIEGGRSVNINAIQSENQLRIQNSYVPEGLRGQGIGKEAYKQLINKAFEAGVPLVSGNNVSEDAVRMYKSLEKEGFRVIKNPLAEQIDTSKGKILIVPDSRDSVFRIEPKAPLTPPTPPIPPSPPPPKLPEFAGEPVGDPLKKLQSLIKEAKPARKELAEKFRIERGERIARVEKAVNEIGGEEGYRQALSALKGELTPGEKIAFEPVAERLTPQETDALYQMTWDHPYLSWYEKVSAASEFTKLISGEIPTPSGLVLLEEVYGSDLIKSILIKRAMGIKIVDFVLDLSNVSRSLMATADMSGVLRQGAVLSEAHPVIAQKAFRETLKFIFSPQYFEQYFKGLPNDPTYKLIRRFKVAVTDPSKATAINKEEAFLAAHLLKKIPILGHIFGASERAYAGYLTKLRVDVFKLMADELLSKGMSPIKDAPLFQAASDMVNNLTGRGGLGRLGNNEMLVKLLNALFFSPRLQTARFNALNPFWYAQMPPPIRKKALGDFAKFVAVGLTILTLASLNDDVEVEADLRSTDSGKIKIGDTRWDIWAGFQQWARTIAQITTGERKLTTTGEIVSLNKDEYPFTTRKDVLLRFIESKLAPTPALILELADGAKTFTGEDTTFEKVIQEKFIPLYIQDIANAYEDGGLGRAVGVGIPAFLGVGVQTQTEKKKTNSFGLPSLPSLPLLPNLPSLPSLPSLPGF